MIKHPDDRDVPWHAFVLAAFIIVAGIAALVQLLEMRSRLDCEAHGGAAVDIRNGWVCIPPLDHTERESR